MMDEQKNTDFKKRVEQVLDDIGYKRQWSFKILDHLVLDETERIEICVELMSDNYQKDGHATLVQGRRWSLTPDMTRSEIVKTIWLAVSTAEMHETRQSFTYKGKRIFDSHLNTDKLLNITPEKEERGDGWLTDAA